MGCHYKLDYVQDIDVHETIKDSFTKSDFKKQR